jgi:Fe-S cluster biogenesis protein NfuA
LGDQSHTPGGQDIRERIERSLDTARPFLRADGGDVKFIRITEQGILELQWLGTCVICPMSRLTLRAGIERSIMHDVPEVRRVEAVAG